VVGRNGARCRGPRHVGALRTSATCAGFGERSLARNDTECFSAPRCSSFLCKLVLHSGGVPHTEPRCGQPDEPYVFYSTTLLAPRLGSLISAENSDMSCPTCSEVINLQQACSNTLFCTAIPLNFICNSYQSASSKRLKKLLKPSCQQPHSILRSILLDKFDTIRRTQSSKHTHLSM